MIFVFSPAHAFTLFFEGETDLPGCDFKNFVVPGANAANRFQTFGACMNACGLDPNCQAWNFDTRSGTGTCFLKNNICGPTVSPGTVGGFRLTGLAAIFRVSLRETHKPA
jgi:PAN domain